MQKRTDFLPLSRPCLGEAEIEAVVACLRSGWITTGPRCQELETRFAASVGAPHAIAATSATAALHLVLLALGIGPGDEIITSPITFASTVNIIALCGATPVFADVDYHTMMLRPELIEERITPRTKAIIPVHIAGAPFDLDPLLAIADRRGVRVIDDAAHCLGTVYKGKPVGSHPHVAIFSFQATKNLTMAEGGIITLHEDELAGHIRRLRFHGLEKLAWERQAKGGRPHYDVSEPGFKYNLPDVMAAIGVVQLSRLDEIVRRRTALAEAYSRALAGIDGLDLPPASTPPDRHGWHIYPVKVRARERDELMARLSEYGIGCGYHFPACHLLRYVRERYGFKRGDFPAAEQVSDRALSLPLFPDMTAADVDYVAGAVREILGGGRMSALPVPPLEDKP